MPTPTEQQIGIEEIENDPFAGEDTEWMTQEKYESATPEHWQTLPVSYFRKKGDNKLVVQSADLGPQSLLQGLVGGQGGSEEAQRTIDSISIHLRSDGLFLWSSSTTKGICIPVGAVATYAPDKLAIPNPPGSTSNEPISASPLPVLRLDLIPDSDIMDMGDDGFAPSLLLHIAFTSKPEPSDSTFFSPDPGALATTSSTTTTTATTTTTSSTDLSIPSPDQQPDQQQQQQSTQSPIESMQRTLQTFLSALSRCQDQLPTSQADSDDEADMERRIRLPAIHIGGGSTGGATVGLADAQGGDQDVIRLAGLEKYGGWVTADNVDEVMRSQGIGIDGLGPGAGSRRQREDYENGDGDGDGDEGMDGDGYGNGDGERVVVWQRTGGS